MSWLVREEDVLASVERPGTVRARTKGLLGLDRFDGAMVLQPCRQVHTIGMRFPIDVAFCDGSGAVLRVCTLAPWRMSRLVWRSRFVIEAQAGAFERWGLQPGDVLEIRA